MRQLSIPAFGAVVVSALLLIGCAGAPPESVMTAHDHFTPCAKAPHCVSSQAPPGSSQHVAPFGYDGSARAARQALHTILADADRMTIVTERPDFIHAIAKSRLGFVDDVYFLIQPDRRAVDVKSSSRLGYYDFGVNRRRVERLRNAFTAQMALHAF